MHTTIKLALLSCMALLGSACATQDTGSGQELAATEGKLPQECRYAKATGSKMRTRICYTPDTWAALDAANAKEQDTDEFFRRATEMSTTADNVSVPAVGASGQ